MALQAGTRLGPYEVLGPIGAGGMGEVYRARDPRLGREVAIKVLPSDRLADEGRRRRFIQEAQAASALNHPHIITIYEIETAADHDFIVMEYVRGKSLDALIPRHGMRLSDALRIAIPVADALAAAHARGIIHRDLKPANVMVGADGMVKVLDFGLAKLLSSESSPDDETTTHVVDATVSVPGSIAGTAAYMSPEQALGGKVDARSDIFSFGTMLYEMVAGVRPFAGASTADVVAAIVRAQPQPLSTIAPATPPDLEKLIARCLRKDPARRFQDVADVKVALQDLKEESDSGATRSQAQASSRLAVLGRHVHQHTLVAAMAAIVILATPVVVARWIAAIRNAREHVADRAPTLTQLTANPAEQSVSSASISPDGKYLAYGDPTGIHVRVIDTGETQRLPDTRGMYVYAWTPDSTKVRASRCDRQTCTGWDVSILGGGSRQPSGATWPASEYGRSTADGSRFLTFTLDGNVNVNLLDGTPAKPLIHAAPADGVQTAMWSADGDRVYFTRASSATIIESISTTGGTAVPVFTAEKGTVVVNLGTLLPNGRAFAVMGKSFIGPYALWEIPVGAPGAAKSRALTEWGPDFIQQMSASSSGSRVTFTRASLQPSDVFVGAFDAKRTVLDTPTRLTLDDREDVAYAWAPDSTTSVFMSNRNGTSDVFKQRVDSDVAEPLVTGPGDQRTPRVTSDGQWVLYTDFQPGKRSTRIMRVPLAGGRPEPVFTFQDDTYAFCHCSLRGRCVLLALGPGQQYTVFALDAIHGRGRELLRLPLTPGSILTPDGNALAYIVPDTGAENHIRVVSFRGEPTREIVVENANHLASLDCPPTGGFLSVDLGAGRSTLVFITPNGHARALWTRPFGIRWAISSPDGKHLAITAGTLHSNVWLAERPS